MSDGATTYSLEAISADPETDPFAVHITSAVLTGLPDISITQVGNDIPGPHPGGFAVLTPVVQNNGTSDLGPVDVTVYLGDPRFPQTPPTVLATQTINDLPPGSTPLLIPVTLPNSAGDFVLTVKADPANLIAESIETNNNAQYLVSFRSDPAVAVNGAGLPVPLRLRC